MAQTKTAARKRSGTSRKAQARTAAKPKANAARKSKPNSQSKARSNSQGKAKAVLQGKPKAAGEAVETTAKDAGRAVGRAASKAKVPLVAGGAALAGAAGGIALGAHQARRHRGIKGLHSEDVAKAARKAGDVGMRLGEVAVEVRRARNSSSNGRTRRSPIEVVLEGLTARRAQG
jgi:RNA-splicing ligase RtcB